MQHRYKITHWKGGVTGITIIYSESKTEARNKYQVFYPEQRILSVVEDKE